MIDALSALLRWLLTVLLLAAAVHFAAVYYLPTFLMARAMERISSATGINAIRHAPPPTHEARAVVRPSPDLVYSTCVFNLTQSHLRIRAEVPQTGYWSISFFADNTDNFFVINNRETTEAEVDILLAGPGAGAPERPGERVVVSPSFRGIALIRVLNEGGEAFAAQDAIRRKATCTEEKR